MGTGPRAADGYDLAITELLDSSGPRYMVEIGTDSGADVMRELATQPATTQDRASATAVTDEAARTMGRVMDTRGLPELLHRNLDHPRWDDVAARCLSCGNCTNACPTCFCSDDIDPEAPDGESTSRVREWASCFSRDFSYIHGDPFARRPQPLPSVDDPQAGDLVGAVRNLRLCRLWVAASRGVRLASTSPRRRRRSVPRTALVRRHHHECTRRRARDAPLFRGWNRRISKCSRDAVATS